MRQICGAWMISFATLSCSAAPKITYDYGGEPDPRGSEYVINVSDRLTIKVWKNAELSGDVLVRPDGVITLPLIGDLRAGGKTPTELRQDISKQLLNYIRDEGAVVTVSVTAVNGYSFTMSGNFEHPGVFTSQKYLSVLEAVQLAGGPNRFASPERMKVFRRDKDGKIREIPINFDDLQAGKRPDANIAIVRDDRVFMP